MHELMTISEILFAGTQISEPQEATHPLARGLNENDNLSLTI